MIIALFYDQTKYLIEAYSRLQTSEKLAILDNARVTFLPDRLPNTTTRLLPDSNDSSFNAESNDTNIDHDFKIIGSVLGHFIPRASWSANKPEYTKVDKR